MTTIAATTSPIARYLALGTRGRATAMEYGRRFGGPDTVATREALRQFEEAVGRYEDGRFTLPLTGPECREIYASERRRDPDVEPGTI